MTTQVLIIATDNTMLVQLTAMLQPIGYDIVTATDGEQGWSVYQDQSPHAVISTVRMPNLDGIGLLRRVRAHAKDLPVVLIATEAIRDSEPEAQALGVTAFVYEPIISVADLTRYIPGNSSTT